MVRILASLVVFSAVILIAGVVTIFGLGSSADTVSRIAASSEVNTANLKPSYIARLPVAKADDLNVATSVPVRSVASIIPEPAVVAAPAPVYTHVVTASSLRVRSGPKKTEPQLFSLKDGSRVTVSQSEGVRGWVQITDESGRQGWVFGGMLSPIDSKQGQPQ